ncbi:SusC/RagA family TonB-linked outer membrane protein [Arcticibacter tournemirensis]|uniref:SusC/RagA family TonB-linked outer membrane protein n=1 Tax=Arcticibacter tournemirensis TaxID=699437 RepID=A0A4Q0MBY8_9SPHI|nr:SusC/RagA family TonB-linked outer membrane protein [Arcticibacter tournemirensis]RXF70593.1 SusC/RagA family TonB-linked outer membrane protein [Arcticibacter tournemirensis]
MKSKKKWFLPILLGCVMLAEPLYAVPDKSPGRAIRIQQTVIKGRVTNANGSEPLIGVSVKVKGSSVGTSTDLNGAFKIAVPGPRAMLVFSYIGYVTKEVQVGNQKELAISLQEQANALSEVVVVGYGSIDRRELTSAVSSLKQEDLVTGSVSPLIAIQGKVPGLNIVSNNGSDPNASVSLQLRGVNSVKASQGPLVVIDGVPGGDINSVAKEDIASINVLRDASAAAIYGTRASGGVILITTKRPQTGQAAVNFTSEYFIESIRKRPEVLSADEYVSRGIGKDNGARTDWYDLVTNNNPFSHRQVINVSGGSETANVYTTFFKRDAKGISIGSERGEIGGRLNSNFKFFDNLIELTTNVSYNQVNADFPGNSAPGNFRDENNSIYNIAIGLDPTISPYNASDPSGYNVLTGGFETWNPLAEVMLRKKENQYRYLLANATVKLNITKELYTSAMFGIKSNTEHPRFFRSAQHRSSREGNVDGYAKQEYKRWDDRIFEWTVGYTKRLDDHQINAVAGYSYQDFNGQGFSAENSDFPVDGLQEHDMGSGTWLVDGRAGLGSWKDPWVKLAAFFGRVNYSFKDRYIITANLRHEGSSKFAPGNRWGSFPGVSVGWRLSQEPFMKSFSFIDDIKIRGGYGETGNEGFGSEVSSRMYSADTWWIFDGRWNRTFGVKHNQNPGIRWEVKKEYNAGIDFAILNNKLSGRFDYYKRVIDDLIYDISVSQPPAIHDKTTMNVGSMENKGIEFELNYNAIKTSNWTYSTSIVAAHNKSTLRSLYGSQTFQDEMNFPAPGSPGTAVRLYPGEAIGQFYLWKFAGFTDDGKWLLYNKNNEIIPADDKKLEDKRFVGNSIPKLQLSWNHTIAYKNWDAGVYLRSWLGYDVFNMVNMYYGIANVKNRNVLKSAFEERQNITGEKQLSDYWLEKGDFLKVDAISLGYTFNKKWIGPFRNIRVYTAGRDLFVFTKYSGLDPEININGLTPGFEGLDVYPKTRTFMFGLQASF